jgi:hypothetical protein
MQDQNSATLPQNQSTTPAETKLPDLINRLDNLELFTKVCFENSMLSADDLWDWLKTSPRSDFEIIEFLQDHNDSNHLLADLKNKQQSRLANGLATSSPTRSVKSHSAKAVQPSPVANQSTNQPFQLPFEPQFTQCAPEIRRKYMNLFSDQSQQDLRQTLYDLKNGQFTDDKQIQDYCETLQSSFLQIAGAARFSRFFLSEYLAENLATRFSTPHDIRPDHADCQFVIDTALQGLEILINLRRSITENENEAAFWQDHEARSAYLSWFHEMYKG